MAARIYNINTNTASEALDGFLTSLRADGLHLLQSNAEIVEMIATALERHTGTMTSEQDAAALAADFEVMAESLRIVEG